MVSVNRNESSHQLASKSSRFKALAYLVDAGKVEEYEEQAEHW